MESRQMLNPTHVYITYNSGCAHTTLSTGHTATSSHTYYNTHCVQALLRKLCLAIKSSTSNVGLQCLIDMVTMQQFVNSFVNIAPIAAHVYGATLYTVLSLSADHTARCTATRDVVLWLSAQSHAW